MADPSCPLADVTAIFMVVQVLGYYFAIYFSKDRLKGIEAIG